MTKRSGGDGILRRDFLLGEEKYIKFIATSCDDLPVCINGATYKLYDDNDKVIEYGACEIDGSLFGTLIKPPAIGDYVLEVEYIIDPETRKVKVHINVS